MEADTDGTQKKNNENEFIPRPYQTQIFENCIQQNSLVYLPTGSGKTYIATMFLKHFSQDLDRPYSSGGQLSFFVVNTVALVAQQASAIDLQLPYKVGKYSGDMNVDLWNRDEWLVQFETNPVLVMTAQIFHDILQHNFLSLSRVNAIVFDECHQAVTNHPMRQAMVIFYHPMTARKPKILGLTAALINSNVKENSIAKAVMTLEETFDAKVIRAVNEDMVLCYSATPREETVVHDIDESFLECTLLVKEEFDKLKDLLKYVDLEDESFIIHDGPAGAFLLNEPSNKLSKKLENILQDIEFIFETLGPYGGYISLATRVIMLEKFKCRSQSENSFVIINAITTVFHLLRKKIFDKMCSEPEAAIPIKFSTHKVKVLLCILENSLLNSETRGIIFVSRRSTAQTLYFILKELSKKNQKFKMFKPNFIVGFNAPVSDTVESHLLRLSNEKVLSAFNQGDVNILFASNVIEEGIDIRLCNLVVKFDPPQTFRSYIQAKGRARNKTSKFVCMIPSEVQPNSPNYKDLLEKFKRIECILKKAVCQDDYEDMKSSDDDDDDSKFVFCPEGENGPKVSAIGAISLLNRYCSSLPQDKFSSLTIEWWMKPSEDKQSFTCILKLPVSSPIKHFLEGPPRKNMFSAKRLASLEACKELYRLKALDRNFQPASLDETFDHLFPHVKMDDDKDEKSAKTGTKKRKRLYSRKYPKVMCECKPLGGSTSYIHIIKISPDYSYPSTERLQAFYKLLKSSFTFGIVTSCPWPQVCSFPLFMNVGKVNIDLITNVTLIDLTSEEIKKIEHFHSVLFSEALSLIKKHVTKDIIDDENSYLIIPVSMEGNKVKIDWKTVDTEKSLPKLEMLPYGPRLDRKVTDANYLNKIVVPWYRDKSACLKYVVTRVRPDQNPESEFPSPNYKSYYKYYETNYNQKIFDLSQPLIEVRAISSKINCLLPRGKSSHKKRSKDDQNIEETLVPELCYVLTFPAHYMLKLTLLPSVLHRLQCLLLADELRNKLAEDLFLDTSDITDLNWQPMAVDDSVLEADDEMNGRMECVDPVLPKHDLLPWDAKDQPVDIYRDLDLDIMSIYYYEEFCGRKLQLQAKRTGIPLVKVKHVRPLQILETKNYSSNPELKDVLTAITAVTANDTINYERFETLGDSFLKFAVSLFLFTNHSELNEGQLTELKGKLIGNANLYHCASVYDLGSIMKVVDFNAQDWKVPGYSLPDEIRNKIIYMKFEEFFDANNSEAILENQEISCLKFDELPDTKSGLTKADFGSFSERDENLGIQVVPDKVVADCVEALICVYLQAYGLRGGFTFLNCFGILPKEEYDIEEFLSSKPPTAQLNSFCIQNLIPALKLLEHNLGYTFSDKSFLLQAITHPSYNHCFTDCYQRLEFLGDAILDFLITSHIYETCGNLTPGDLTDLRSALVCNVTFACLTVRYQFHACLLHKAPLLDDVISRFVKIQDKRNHAVGLDALFLIDERDIKVAEVCDVPKILGDIFESLAGAVYLDSGRSLQTVWNVFYKLMAQEIAQFSTKIPKNPVRVLYEAFPHPHPKFGKALPYHQKVIVPLGVYYKNKEHQFYGCGDNKAQAKIAAAKIALKSLGES